MTRWVDAHMDSILDHASGRRNWLQKSVIGHADLPRLMEAGIQLQVLAHFVHPSGSPEVSMRKVLHLLAYSHRILRDPRVLLVKSRSDLDSIASQDRLGLLFGLEGGECIGGDLTLFECLFELGIRVFNPVWNERNSLADGALFSNEAGLTPVGREAIRLANQLGVIIDVSHLNEVGFWQVLEESSSPVIASHSNAYACCKHPRNLKDDQIVALADAGGVVGINFCPVFLNGTDRAAISDVVRHVDHIVQLVGSDHVGIGSDFDGIPNTPYDLSDVTELPELVRALAKAGYAPDDVDHIMGKNFWNLFALLLPAPY